MLKVFSGLFICINLILHGLDHSGAESIDLIILPFSHQWWVEGISDVLWRVISVPSPDVVAELLVGRECPVRGNLTSANDKVPAEFLWEQLFYTQS